LSYEDIKTINLKSLNVSMEYWVYRAVIQGVTKVVSRHKGGLPGYLMNFRHQLVQACKTLCK